MNNRRILSLFLSLTLSLIAMAILLLLTSPSIHAQTTLRYVATTGTDSGGCIDPKRPCRTVQYAVDASVDGDLIKVAAGTYADVHGHPSPPGDPYPPPGGIVYQVVYVAKSVTIRGGYGADYAEPPDPETYTTTLDAQGQGRGMYIIGEIGTTVEGLSIVNGQMGDPSQESGYGGGVYIISATATLSNCTVRDNNARFQYEDGWPRPEGGQGGGLYVYHGDVRLLRNRIQDNDAWFEGGGLYLENSQATVTDNMVQSNSALGSYASSSTGAGGGLYLSHSQATLFGNIIQANETGHGGGLYLSDSDAALTANNIQNNSAHAISLGSYFGSAGGLYLLGSEATLIDNTIQDNHANVSGGGLYLEDSNATLTDNVINDNDLTGWDWGWCYGTGLGARDSQVTLTGNWVQNNTAPIVFSHGALYLSGSQGQLTNNVIADNEGGDSLTILSSTVGLQHNTIARTTGGNDGGVLVGSGSAVSLTNTILVSHTIGITVAAGSTATLQATLWGAGIWANGLDWGGGGSIVTGTPNVWGAPGFVDPDAGDYHVIPGGLGLNRGTDVGVISDIDRQPRPQGLPDLGADEYWPAATLTQLYLPLVSKGQRSPHTEPTPTPTPWPYDYEAVEKRADCTKTWVQGSVLGSNGLPQSNVQMRVGNDQGWQDDVWTGVNGYFQYVFAPNAQAGTWFVRVLEGGQPRSDLYWWETTASCIGADDVQEVELTWRER